jgi:hypothetical protein
MKRTLFVILIMVGLCISGCADTKSHTKSVYMLLDTSGTYTRELKGAHSIINYLLGSLKPGDSFAVARIDSGSFSEKDIITKVTFDRRPSFSNNQKRTFSQKVDEFIKAAKGSSHTDISGGVLQAVEYLNETGAGKKYILIFSDLKEDLVKGHIRDFPIQMNGVEVIALNVTKLRSDNIDPREYMDRLTKWGKKVEAGGATWRVLNDLERLDRIFDS